ncbi:MAG: efflux RND transporter periplasmic adaptor subunit [Pirellulaceae bacterium]
MNATAPAKPKIAPWVVRWILGGAMLMALGWVVFFSHEAKGHRKSPAPLPHNVRQQLGGDAVAVSADSLLANAKDTGTQKNYKPPANGTQLLVRAYTIPKGGAGVVSQRTFSGTLQARYQSLLGFRVAGKIIERHVEVGDRVAKGQVLFRLDPTYFDLKIQVAESDLEAAKSQLIQNEADERRLEELRQTRSTSQSDYELALAARDTARARLRAAENRWMMARNQRDYAVLIADQDGLVTKIMAEVGQVVSPGQPLVHWVQGSDLEAVVSIPESLQRMLDQRHATIRFWSRPDLSVRGVLREISPVADPLSRTYDARFTLMDPPNDLALGLTATVVIDQADTDGILVPMGAIAQSDTAPIVWRIGNDGSVEAIAVEILKYGSQRALIKGPLAPGDQIVSAGVQRIDTQCRVRVWQDTL